VCINACEHVDFSAALASGTTFSARRALRVVVTLTYRARVISIYIPSDSTQDTVNSHFEALICFGSQENSGLLLSGSSR
jgi:hypothetical protein